MGAAGAGGAYEIEKSLRFNRGDAPRLVRTSIGTPTNNKIAIWSAWIKLTGSSGVERCIFGGRNDSTGYNNMWFNINASHIFVFYAKNSSNNVVWNFRSKRVFRDYTGWMHVFVVMDTPQNTEADRLKVYFNGVEETIWDTSGYGHVYPDEDLVISSWCESGENHYLGVEGSGNGENFDGYLAEMYYIDGQAKAVGDFGETNADTGQWVPKEYDGTYGNNGFYLNFSDNSNTTAGTLGADSSGNDNNFTPTNFSVAAGAGNDSLEDTPTNNFCTGNPLSGRTTNYADYSNGGLDFSIGSTEHFFMPTMLFPQSGKWYVECLYTTVATGRVGVSDYKTQSWGPDNGTGHWAGISYLQGGTIRVDDSDVQSSLTSVSADDIIGVAVNRDAGTVQFSINGTNKGSAVNISSLGSTEDLSFHVGRNGSSGGNPVGSVNFGQRPFANQPTDFLPLCTANLPEPTILKGSDYFNTVLYTGDGQSSKALTVGFQPDLCWFKARSATHNHDLYDSVRGGTKRLIPNETTAEASYTNLVQSFDANGVTVGSATEMNASGATFAAWNWKESAVSGFDIVGFVGNITGRTLSHSLGVAPEFIIAKNREVDDVWQVYHASEGEDRVAFLNRDDNFYDANSSSWNSTAPTSSVFSIGSDTSINGDGEDCIAYLFTSVEGYSKVGSYTGNGNADGPFVYTGFKPAWIMMKDSSGSNSWEITDTTRYPYNDGRRKILRADTNETEFNETDAYGIDILSNGFKPRYGGSSINDTGPMIYLAFAETPFKYATAR